MKKRLHKVAKLAIGIKLAVVLALGLFEMAYQQQWWDFYAVEWKALNEGARPKEGNYKVLVFGDSFGAQPDGFVEKWREADSTVTIYNASIPGTCGVQHAMILARRLADVTPDLVLFQVYEGNDLWDASLPTSQEAFSWQRNTFYRLASWWKSLAYLNYKFGQLKWLVNQDGLETGNPKKDGTFSPNAYHRRTQLYLEANPHYLSETFTLKGKWARDGAQTLVSVYRSMIDQLPDSTQYQFLLIPHCTRVAQHYADQYRQMGATLVEQDVESSGFKDKLIEAFGKAHVYDAMPTLKDAEENGVACYFANDPHLNDVGHRQIMTEISKIWL